MLFDELCGRGHHSEDPLNLSQEPLIALNIPEMMRAMTIGMMKVSSQEAKAARAT